MITPDDALQFIKDHHNGEIPYTFGKNEYARWMAEFANHTVTKHLHKLGVSGKQPDHIFIRAAAAYYAEFLHDKNTNVIDYNASLLDFEAGAKWMLSQVAGVPTRSEGKAGD
jgi:hypothetical protein